MIELTPALAGQIAVTAIIAVGTGLLILGLCYTIYCQYQEMKGRYALRLELRKRATQPTTPAWNPDNCEDDEIVDDVEHLRPFHEHQQHQHPLSKQGA